MLAVIGSPFTKPQVLTGCQISPYPPYPSPNPQRHATLLPMRLLLQRPKTPILQLLQHLSASRPSNSHNNSHSKNKYSNRPLSADPVRPCASSLSGTQRRIPGAAPTYIGAIITPITQLHKIRPMVPASMAQHARPASLPRTLLPLPRIINPFSPVRWVAKVAGAGTMAAQTSPLLLPA